MATINVLDAAGATVAVEKPPAPGRASAAASRPVALSTEDAAFLDGVETLLTGIAGSLSGTLAVGAHAVTNAGTFAVQATKAGTWDITNAGTFAVQAAQVGTWNVNSHAVTNAGTFAVQAVQNSAWNITNISGTVSLPTGAATAAIQTTSNTSLTAIAASVAGTLTVGAHAVTNAGTFAVQATQSGTWNIGTVTTMPARVATADSITAKLATDAIQNGLTALTPKFAAISASASGNNTVVAAVGGKKIRVLEYSIMANGAVNAKFQSGAGGTDLTGLKYFDGAGAGIAGSFSPLGKFETAVSALLNLNLSGAVAVGGELVYVEV